MTNNLGVRITPPLSVATSQVITITVNIISKIKKSEIDRMFYLQVSIWRGFARFSQNISKELNSAKNQLL